MADTRVLELIIRARDQASATLNKLGESTESLSGKIRIAGLTMVSFGSAVLSSLAVSLRKSIEPTINYTKTIITIKRLTGATAEESSKLASIFYRLGIDTGKIAVIFKSLSSQIENKNSVLTKYGIATKDVRGKNRELIPVLMDLADKYSNMRDKAAANVLAAKSLGRGYGLLLPILSAGRKGIAELIKKAEEYGLVLTENNVEVVKKYIKAQKDLELANTGLKLSFGLVAIQIKARFIEQLVKLTSLLSKISPETREAIIKITGLTGVISLLSGAFLIIISYTNVAFSTLKKGILLVYKTFGVLVVGGLPAVALISTIGIAALVIYRNWEKLKKLFEKFISYLKEETTSIVEKWEKLREVFEKYKLVFVAFIDSFSQAIFSFEKMKPVLKLVITLLLFISKPIALFILAAITVYERWGKIKVVISDVWKRIKPFFEWAKKIIGEALVASLNNLKDAWEALRPEIEKLFPYLKTIGLIFAGIVAVGIIVAAAAITALIVVITKVIQVVTYLIRVGTEFSVRWRLAWLTILNFIASVVLNLIRFFTNLPVRIAETMSRLVFSIYISFIKARNKAREGTLSLVLSVISIFKQLPAQIYLIGVNIVKGIWKGINDWNDWIRKKIQSWAANIVKWIKWLLQVRSPSKVFEKIGISAAQGFALGLSKPLKLNHFVKLATAGGTTNHYHYHYDKLEVVLPNVKSAEQFMRELEHDLRNRR